ncbi:hypothetical protein Dimus_039585 [Dionaea muscipula]
MPPRRARRGQNQDQSAESAGAFGAPFLNQMMETMREIAQAARGGQQQHNVEPRATSAMREFQRLNPPTFDGAVDPLEAEEWLEQVTQILDTLQIMEEDLRVSFATFQLRGDARHWWRLTSQMVGSDWEDFREAFLEKYIPESARDALREEFEHLVQRNMTVDEYAARFTSLLRFAPHVATETLRCKRFEAGLRPSIREKLASHRYRIFSELLESARAVERTITANQIIRESSRARRMESSEGGRESKRQKSTSSGSSGSQRWVTPRSGWSASGSGSSTSGSTGRSLEVCYFCQQPGHVVARCPVMSQSRASGSWGPSLQQRQTSAMTGQQSGGSVICHLCYQSGHMRRDCPMRMMAPRGVNVGFGQSSQIFQAPQSFGGTQHTFRPSSSSQRGGPSQGGSSRGGQATRGRVFALCGNSPVRAPVEDDAPTTQEDVVEPVDAQDADLGNFCEFGCHYFNRI